MATLGWYRLGTCGRVMPAPGRRTPGGSAMSLPGRRRQHVRPHRVQALDALFAYRDAHVLGTRWSVRPGERGAACDTSTGCRANVKSGF